MKIGIYTESITQFVEHLCFFLTLGGRHEIVLRFDRDALEKTSDHQWSLPRVQTLPGVDPAPIGSDDPEVGTLLIHTKPYRRVGGREVLRWAEKAGRVVVLGDRAPGSLRQLANDLRHNLPYARRADAAFLQSCPAERNPYFWIRRVGFYRPYAHPQLLCHPAWRSAFERALDPATDGSRPFHFCYIGATEPPERAAVLAAVKQELKALGYEFTSDPAIAQSRPDRAKLAFWVEYSADDHSAALEPAGYLAVMQRSRFCLSPEGYGYWTHRTAEALCCGAIPILQHPERYLLGLQDGRHCLHVAGGDWGAAVRRAAALLADDAEPMREAVAALRTGELTFGGVARWTEENLFICPPKMK